MMILFFNQLSNLTGLPLIVSIFAFVVTSSLVLFGILILIKVRSIKKGLNDLNDRLDIISQGLGWQSREFENTQPYKFKLGSHVNDELAADGRTNSEINTTADSANKKGSEEHRINMEIRKFLKKVGITSQREIEKALQAASGSGKLSGGEQLSVTVKLEMPEIGLVHTVDGAIALD